MNIPEWSLATGFSTTWTTICFGCTNLKPSVRLDFLFYKIFIQQTVEYGLSLILCSTEYERQSVFNVDEVINELKQALFVVRSSMKHKVRLELNCFKDDSKMIIGLRASSSGMERLKDSTTIFITLPVELLKNGQLQLGQNGKLPIDNKMTQLKDWAEVATTPFSAHVPTSSMRMLKNITQHTLGLFKVRPLEIRL